MLARSTQLEANVRRAERELAAARAHLAAVNDPPKQSRRERQLTAQYLFLREQKREARDA